MDPITQPPANVLGRVRALLAKAESTEFAAEAEALTAKAQDLMARYRIERAMVVDRASGHRPSMLQVTIETPHADAKVRILTEVASANTCTVVWTPGIRRASVFGYPDDLTAVEMLFTSLLVQATVAVHRAGPSRDSIGRTRTVSFRRSFLIAFALRIGQRLREAADRVVDEMGVSTGTDLVPLLHRRSSEVVAAARAAFPVTRRMTTRVGNDDGWREGRACADRADLGGPAGFHRLSAETANVLPSGSSRAGV